MRHLIQHLRANAVAYVALFFSVGGGGVGYAIAATSAGSTIHGCVYTKTGELLIKSRCDKAEKAISWSQSGNQGVGSVSAYADVVSSGFSTSVEIESGLTVQNTGTGTYTVTPSQNVCGFPAFPVVSITPEGVPQVSGVPVVFQNGGTDADGVVQLTAGVLANGSFTRSNAIGFDIQLQCGAHAQ